MDKVRNLENFKSFCKEKEINFEELSDNDEDIFNGEDTKSSFVIEFIINYGKLLEKDPFDPIMDCDEEGLDNIETCDLYEIEGLKIEIISSYNYYEDRYYSYMINEVKGK